MEKITFKAALLTGRKTWEGYLVATGLVVHRKVLDFPSSRSLWYLSHIESGYVLNVRGFGSRRQAVRYAELLQAACPNVDWTKAGATVNRKVIRDLGGRGKFCRENARKKRQELEEKARRA